MGRKDEPARAVCSAHNGGVVDMAALGEGLASVSAGMLRYHAVGGLPQATLPAPEAGPNAPLCFDSCLTFPTQKCQRMVISTALQDRATASTWHRLGCRASHCCQA